MSKTVRFAGNEEKAIGGIAGLIVLQFKIVFWIIKGLIRLVTFGYAFYRAHNPPALGIPEDSRFEHTLILSGSGHGKTQTIQHMISLDIPEVERGNCSVIVIDSQGDMIKNILRLKALAPSSEATVEASQLKYPPAPELPKWLQATFRFLWQVTFVSLLLFGVMIIGALSLFVMPDSNIEMYAFIVVVPLAFSSGIWLKKLNNPPSLLPMGIGAAIILTLFFLDARDIGSIGQSIGVIAPFFLGFFSVSRRKAPDPSEAPQPVVEPAPIPKQLTLADRLIYIDPTDIYNPPALNLFDFGLDRIAEYDAVEQERMLNGAIAMYEYVFGALLGAELTNRQGVIFRYIARLMMVVPGATIHTLIEFMEEPEKVAPHLSKLDPTTQRFFTTQFFSSRFDATRGQISDRLWGIMATGTLERLFSHPKNKLNLFEAMNRGSLILINTAKEYLKREQCEIFGRFLIALIAQATQERAAMPSQARLPTFIYLDEAQDYFGDEGVGIGELLNQGRKYRVGLILAFQNLGQLDRKLQASLMASTALKYVGGVSAGDAADLAKEMHCEKEFIQDTKKIGNETQFAVYIKNVTPQAVGLSIPFGLLESQPKMTQEEQKELIALNRARISGPTEERRALPKINLATQSVGFELEEPPKM